MTAAIDFATYHALVQLYADYASAVDSGDWSLWPEFFVDACSYRLVPRENHERGLPQATLHVVDDGDHSFAVRMRSGRDQAAVRGELVDASLAWLATAVQA